MSLLNADSCALLRHASLHQHSRHCLDGSTQTDVYLLPKRCSTDKTVFKGALNLQGLKIGGVKKQGWKIMDSVT